jgi:plastocyanin
VTFPTAGDYKLVCLYHQNQTAMIHVLDLSAELPHDQAFYRAEAADMEKDMLSSAGHLMDEGNESSKDQVTAGTGSIVATGGGTDTLSVMRFMHPDKVIHVGETVEWTNDDPITPHTITFGVEPGNPVPPSGSVKIARIQMERCTLPSVHQETMCIRASLLRLRRIRLGCLSPRPA